MTQPTLKCYFLALKCNRKLSRIETILPPTCHKLCSQLRSSLAFHNVLPFVIKISMIARTLDIIPAHFLVILTLNHAPVTWPLHVAFGPSPVILFGIASSGPKSCRPILASVILFRSSSGNLSWLSPLLSSSWVSVLSPFLPCYVPDFPSSWQYK